MERSVPVALVVDDDRLTREMLRTALTGAGVATVDAVDGEDALERLRAGLRPSVVITDMVMPRLGGWGLLLLMRADPALARIPVVTMSAYTARPDAFVEVTARLRKPLDLDDVVPLIQSICQASPTSPPRRD